MFLKPAARLPMISEKVKPINSSRLALGRTLVNACLMLNHKNADVWCLSSMVIPNTTFVKIQVPTNVQIAMSESGCLDAKRNHAITEKCREAKWLWHGWFLPMTWQGFPTMVYYDIVKFDQGRKTLKRSNWNFIWISSYCHEDPPFHLHQTHDIKLPAVAARNCQHFSANSIDNIWR